MFIFNVQRPFIYFLFSPARQNSALNQRRDGFTVTSSSCALLFIHRHSVLLGLLDNDSPSLLFAQCVSVWSVCPPSPAVVERFRSSEPSSNPNMDPCDTTSEEKTGSSMSAAQRRAEMRRRKLLLNSEDRLNRIVGYAKNGSDNNGRKSQRVNCRALHVNSAQNTIYFILESTWFFVCSYNESPAEKWIQVE